MTKKAIAEDTSWFDLKKYDQLENFDLGQWYDQFLQRHLLYCYLNRDTTNDFSFNHFDNDDIKNWDDWAEWKIAQIKENPILTFIAEPMILKNQPIKRNSYDFDTFSVKSLSLWNIKYMSEFLSEIISQNMNFDSSMKENKDLMDTPFTWNLDNVLDETGYPAYGKTDAWINVDLKATDTQILKEFKYWLSKYRSAIDYKPNFKIFTNEHFTRWYNYKLLSYIDMKLVEKKEDKCINNSLIASKIIPADYVEKKIERTINPLARKIMQSNTLNAMNAQLKSESQGIKL